MRCNNLIVCLFTASAAAFASAAERPLVRLSGRDFKGGAAAVYGSDKHGQQVNYVYAASTGGHATMKAGFELKAVPAGSLLLFVKGLDDDFAEPCPIEIMLNGASLHKGPSGFDKEDWKWRHYPIPAGTLKAGRNELVILNRAAEGKLGMPPWFMVAAALIGGDKLDPDAPPGIEEDFRVDLPKEVRPIPEPLPEGAKPGFPLRGIKGWNWTTQQYLAEIPVLARYKMNFLMNCYLSMFAEGEVWHSGKANRWWEPMSPGRKAGFEEIVRSCQRHGIDFCFSINPNLASPRILKYDSPKDLKDLWQHFDWMAGIGVKWFSICLDDISQGIDAAGQARVVNEIFRRLRAKNPDAQMIFCPTRYWGDGSDPASKPYLQALATKLHPEVYCFWTGDAVVGQITRKAAETYRGYIGHKLVIWDNYPVNDSAPTLHLGPVIRRDSDLNAVCDGYMANPLCPQNEINRIPIITQADYAYNPQGYDAARSIGQAIASLAETPDGRNALRDLVELYPGMLLTRQGTGWNPVIAHFQQLLATPHSRHLAAMYLRHAEECAARMERCFPDRFKDAVTTLRADITKMKALRKARYGE